jgi:hypothetical protein
MISHSSGRLRWIRRAGSMKLRSDRLLADERGLEVVQFVAMGAIMLALIATVYNALNGSGTLRSAIRGVIAYYASHFGEDISVRGPCLPGEGSSTEQARTSGACGVNLMQIILFDPTTRAVILTRPNTQEPVIVRAALWQQIVLDPVTHQVTLYDPQQRRVISFDPVSWQAVAMDPVTAQTTPLRIELFRVSKAVEVRFAPVATGLDQWVATPVVSVPLLLVPTGG